MKRTVSFDGKVIEYELIFKKVKNINLHIKRDGKVSVSASKWVSVAAIDRFVLSKAQIILTAAEKISNTEKIPQKEYFSESDLKQTILGMCEKAYPYFEKRGISFPQIKFRKMVSRWGSCHTGKKILTLILT